MIFVNKEHGFAKLVAPNGYQVPNTIVIHALAEFIDVGRDDFTGWDYLEYNNIGAHYYVHPSGAIVQSIPDDVMGRHAKGFNTDTIGIEFIVPGVYTYQTFTEKINDPGWMTYQQTEAGLKLIDHLIEKNKKIKYVTSHRHLDPNRKRDPGNGFPKIEFEEKINLPKEHINI